MLTLLSEGITKTQIARSFDLGSTSLVVVSPALRAAQIKPNKQMNMAIAFLLGLMGSVGLVFLLEFLDNTIKTPEDVARHLELPVMGSSLRRQPGRRLLRSYYKTRCKNGQTQRE